MTICNSELCTGCGVCSNVCLKNAVEMITDKRGFLHPVINEELCIHCEKCLNTCPVNNELTINEFQKSYYAAWNKNHKIKKNSSSGGVFSAISEWIIKNNGIVVGVKWTKDFKAEYAVIDDIGDLSLLMGSKYVQADTGSIYEKINKLLDSGELVLFCGTPCHVHALKIYLNKTYDNLYTIDLICHGVPSYQLFRRYLSEVSDDQLDKIETINLRYKKPCWNYSSVKIQMNDREYMTSTADDPYYVLFNFNYSLRESCHQCKYTTLNRMGDITLADFWGYRPKSFKMNNYDKGVSCVIINSLKGSLLFEKIKVGLKYEQSNEKDVLRSNQCLRKPFINPENIEDFWNDYENGMSIKSLKIKYVPKPFSVPKYLWLRRLKWRFSGVFGK